jgi:transcriptional regulator with XRE-family HTH domain
MAKHGHAALVTWGPALAKAMESSRDLRTQTALARKSGVAQSTIGRILRGEVVPQSASLQRIARALRMPLATLLDVAQVESLDSGREGSEPAFVERALRQALAHREDRRRAEDALATLRRKEEEAIEHLQDLVRKCGIQGTHDELCYTEEECK